MAKHLHEGLAGISGGIASDTGCGFPVLETNEQVRAIISEVRAGNVDRFEVLVEQFQDIAFKVAWQVTRNHDDASDVVQETFLRVYRALGSWTGKAKFSTWVYRIAMNTSLDYLRRQSKHFKKRMYVPDDPDENIEWRQELEGVDERSPLDMVQASRRRELVQRLLRHVSPMQRKCIMLHYFEDLSVKEISDIVGCSVGSVKRHIFRARNRLKELVKDLER